MWYLGNQSRTRQLDFVMGYAESDDGLIWREHPRNPILTSKDLLFGRCFQTPHVLFDSECERFRMWFVASDGRFDEQGRRDWSSIPLAYAESPDGIRWEMHPEPLYPNARRPCVLMDGPRSYRMWMNSAPDPSEKSERHLTNIWRFTSSDGLQWTRDPEPAVTADDIMRSVVYPFVLYDGGQHIMWYGGHVAGGIFEIYCSTSNDGLAWVHHRQKPAFAATRDRNVFDGRYTSTPCVIEEETRYLLYYSARDWGTLFGAEDGTVQCDGSGIYRHIGVAVLPRSTVSQSVDG